VQAPIGVLVFVYVNVFISVEYASVWCVPYNQYVPLASFSMYGSCTKIPFPVTVAGGGYGDVVFATTFHSWQVHPVPVVARAF
jgi:hypothetical protein